METKPAAEEAAGAPLKYQTWSLKVSIHCEGCKKKVKKLLQAIDGVYTTTVDSQQHKVTVTGNVEAETLLKKLARSGKHAELWPETKSSADDQKKESGKDQKQEAPENGHNNSAEKSPKDAKNGAEDQLPAEQTGPEGGGNRGKKNKKKGQKGNSTEAGGNNSGDAPAVSQEPVPPYPPMNLGPPDHQADDPFPPIYYEPPLVIYSIAYPTSPCDSYYGPSMHPNAYPPSDTFDGYNSDEFDYDDYDYDNDDEDDEDVGCSIM